MNFEWALNAWIGNPSPVCIHAQQCGRSLVIEHSGDVYACDHCVYPQYKLGNIMTDELTAMVESLCSRVSARQRKQPCRAGAATAAFLRPVRADAPSTALQKPATMSRGFSICVKDIKNFFCISANICGPLRSFLKTGFPRHT